MPVATPTPTPVATPVDTGRISVFKTLCEAIGQQDTCNGRDTSLAGYMIDFQIFAGTATTGSPVETVTLTLGQNANGGGNLGNGSQGRIISPELAVGTYTVCEVEVAYNDDDQVALDAEPRPEAGNGGSSGGGQTQSGDNCITVELTSGTAELKFLDQTIAPAPTPTPGATPTPTPQATPTLPPTDASAGPSGQAGLQALLPILLLLLSAAGLLFMQARVQRTE